jgi:LAO/AO transport system kinase
LPLSEPPLRGRTADFGELRAAFGSPRFKPLFSRALSEIERDSASAASCALLLAAEEAAGAQHGHVVGVTGPPGVGKSSLIGALVRHWRRAGLSVGVIAVDPSSAESGGALLGDRTRMAGDPGDAHVFVRSMATRGRLGGLSEHCYPAIAAMRGLFDRVLVETVGVGQSEIEVRGAVDTVVVCVQPGSGDVLQFMKAGIGEIPDIIVVTKSDVGEAAQRTLGELASAAATAPGEAWTVKALLLSSRDGSGLERLSEELEHHRKWLSEQGLLAAQRTRQDLAAVTQAIVQRWGRDCLERARRAAGGASPFALWRYAAGAFARS